MKKPKLLLIACSILLAGATARSQQLVESIAAVVGNEVIYLSDLELTISELRRTGNRLPVETLRNNIFQEMLITKLFIDQARIDSIEVTDENLDGEVNMRVNDAIRRAGSEEALVEYFKKNMIEIRRDIRRTLREQQVVSEVQAKIAENLTMTPSGVKRFYNSLPQDSLPVIPARYELNIIQLDPPALEDSKAEARQRLLEFRSRIVDGENFSVLARLYSEDTESAKSGGEIGYLTRGELDKEYANAAFALTNNNVSRIVESQFGFHIIQLIDRKGDLVNTRHILIRPKVNTDQAQKAISKLDSIANLVRRDSIKFDNAALMFSSHKDSRINGGKLVSPDPGSRVSWLALEELNPDMYVRVRDLKVGEISEPFSTTDEKNNPVFRIVKVTNQFPAHKANVKDDYQILYEAAMMEKRQKLYEEWIKNKIERTYIKIGEEYKSCDFLQQGGWLK
ncbi:MAG: peptidylprolyl isomerase [Bacteroidales bacterium]|jgi:peptidyl-prolyl cis-trans isomerase SurA|nr:peptidylprolyl isomerase [Bacteroidales bacterium]